MPVRIKICGITSRADAVEAIAAGADAIGINLIPLSKRYVPLDHAMELLEAVGGRAEAVAVMADPAEAVARQVLAAGFDRIQLHGTEQPELVALLQPSVYQALRIGEREDADRALGFVGERVLVDAKIPGELGGTGRVFDWQLVAGVCRHRRTILAGGLTPQNVAEAVRRLAPWGVDTASGVESSSDPRRKSAERLRAFIAAARRAAA